MAEKTAPSLSQQSIQIAGNSAAPFIYFDGVGAPGLRSGIVQIELAATTVVPIEGGTTQENIVTAHLRATPAGLATLKDAIQKIEMMLAPTDGPVN